MTYGLTARFGRAARRAGEMPPVCLSRRACLFFPAQVAGTPSARFSSAGGATLPVHRYLSSAQDRVNFVVNVLFSLFSRVAGCLSGQLDGWPRLP